MRIFVISCVAAIVIAAVGGLVLSLYQEPVAVAYSTTAVRI